MKNREFDIIIWGATGFTGKLVVTYLWEKYGNHSFRWAVAGRDREKLEQVIAESGLEGIPYILADSFDLASLRNMARRTRVICATVGPYIRYGDGMVKACIEEECHYCDLTGEIPWMRKMIDRYHEAAREKKLKIVHACGFDSIPSDLGVRKVQEEFYSRYGYYAQKVATRVAGIKGQLSGGTYSSMMNMIDLARNNPDIRRTATNMYALNPDPAYAGADKSDLKSVKKDRLTGSWLCPFIMAGINTKVVRRSHALAGFPYGANFSYEEAMMGGKGIRGRIKATIVLVVLGLLTAARPGSFLKRAIDRRMPRPGEGPGRKERDTGYFRFLIFAGGEGNDQIILTVRGYRDPGYGSTCRMLGESAVSLLGEDLPEMYGVLTPSAAMGEVLEKRLVGEVDFYVEA